MEIPPEAVGRDLLAGIDPPIGEEEAQAPALATGHLEKRPS